MFSEAPKFTINTARVVVGQLKLVAKDWTNEGLVGSGPAR